MEKQTPATVAIIVLTWDCNGQFFNLLKSLRKNIKNSFELIVFDNGSSLSSFADILHFLNCDENKHCHVIRSEMNIGFTHGNNSAVKYVFEDKRYKNIKYLFFINSDMEILEKDFDQKMMNVFDEKEKVGVVGGGLYPIFWDSNANFILQRNANKTVECQTVQGSLFVIRRETIEFVINQRGFFLDSNFSPAFHEESEMMIWLLKNGYHNYWALVEHFHDSMASPTKKHSYNLGEKCKDYREYQDLKNKHRLLLFEKHKDFFNIL